MQRYEYHVVPAPKKGKRAKGVKGGEARFAHAVAEVMNEMAADGWDYLRTDTLPSEERSGIAGRTTVFQNLLVFRRAFSGETPAQSTIATQVEDETEDNAPRLPSATEAQALPEEDDTAESVDGDDVAETDEDADEADDKGGKKAAE